ncbi:MAG: cation diffusion facilitator family transporter [Burkholderiales bacterium]
MTQDRPHISHDHDHEDEHEHEHEHEHHDHDKDHAHHGHSHGIGHGHAPKDFGRAFLLGIILNAGFVVAEVIYGIFGNSLALLADAGHNLSDVLGLLLAWGASVLVKRAPTQRYTYGLRSTSILAALGNAGLLLMVTGGIAWEAILRFDQPSAVVGKTVIIVAAFGVAINLGSAVLFMAGRKNDLNVRGAFTHMVGDAIISLGVVIAGFAIIYTGWQWLDPVVSLIIAILILAGTWGLLRDSINLALHGVPEGIDIERVRVYLKALDGVSEVHDLHVWAMSTTETALTAHLIMPSGYPDGNFLNRVSDALEDRFDIHHATIQIETDDTPNACKLAPAEVV